ncbi:MULTISPECIES: DUF6773 family protein [Bacillus]|uniref:DUF6773 family protein n=1 Tax=Bacillus TaxID=1386 RepID=UPI000BB934CA|nr:MULTISPECIES: DUF6773 family protein [Bacillus]
MNFFNKNAVLKDERIVALQNRIYREIYYLVIGIIFVSLAYKLFVGTFDLQNIALELILLLTVGAYYTLRSMQLGVFSAEVELHDQQSKVPMKWKTVLTGVVLGIGIALFFGINSAIRFAETTAEAYNFFFLVFFVSLIIYLPFFLIFFGGSFLMALKGSEKAMEKELLDDEEKVN